MTRPFTPDAACSVGPNLEVAALQQVMRAVEDRLPDILIELPQSHRPLLANALLNLSVNHILSEEGGPATAAILQRLAALIRTGHLPASEENGFRLDGQDA
jgi:hypothetical protein